MRVGRVALVWCPSCASNHSTRVSGHEIRGRIYDAIDGGWSFSPSAGVDDFASEDGPGPLAFASVSEAESVSGLPLLR